MVEGTMAKQDTIGTSLVAITTSLPELVKAVAAVRFGASAQPMPSPRSGLF